MPIRHLYISPGHNYFGRHGQPPGAHPGLEAREVKCAAGQEIQGGRFFGCKPDCKGRITFFAWETCEAVSRELAAVGKPPPVFRRNVVAIGVDLNDLIGREFQIQGVRFSGAEECRPCHWMDEAFAPGVNEFLKGRGGLRAVILSGGFLRANTP